MADTRPGALPQDTEPDEAAPRRRSHAERRAETRAALIAAVLASVADVGFQRTTAVEISRRAGLTWGAVQHHFGGKDGILAAVVEESFARFAARIEAVPLTGPLEERVSIFIDRAWDHYSSADYRATHEIMMHLRSREERSRDDSWQQQRGNAWSAIWLQLFHDAPASERRMRMISGFAQSALSGMAASLNLEGEGAVPSAAQLSVLKTTILRELGSA